MDIVLMIVAPLVVLGWLMLQAPIRDRKGRYLKKTKSGNWIVDPDKNPGYYNE